ncbi:hypothetical protein V7S43_013204 [Phytophthora oleae]|uniref:Uncharacterized protein n=1 Tax=Phytophthora oleae TaxID=2107226 RepID=A0ABD3F5Z9_9STRA
MPRVLVSADSKYLYQRFKADAFCVTGTRSQTKPPVPERARAQLKTIEILDRYTDGGESDVGAVIANKRQKTFHLDVARVLDFDMACSYGGRTEATASRDKKPSAVPAGRTPSAASPKGSRPSW